MLKTFFLSCFNLLISKQKDEILIVILKVFNWTFAKVFSFAFSKVPCRQESEIKD
mgnify:CR=1 FL=1